MGKFIGLYMGKLLTLINSETGNFILSLILFLVITRLLLSILDFLKTDQFLRLQVYNPFANKIKQKYLGKDNEKFQNATFEIIDITRANKILFFIYAFVIDFPIIIGIFFVLYNPISVLFGVDTFNIDSMWNVAKDIVKPGFSHEMDIINAVHINANAFSKFNVAEIAKINADICGINLFTPAKTGDISMILPVYIITTAVYRIIKSIYRIIKKKDTFQKGMINFGLSIFICIVMTSIAFAVPVVYYLYLFVFQILGYIVNRLLKMYPKARKKWIRQKNTECQEVLKKYEIDDFVSAFKDEMREHEKLEEQKEQEELEKLIIKKEDINKIENSEIEQKDDNNQKNNIKTNEDDENASPESSESNQDSTENI